MSKLLLFAVKVSSVVIGVVVANIEKGFFSQGFLLFGNSEIGILAIRRAVVDVIVGRNHVSCYIWIRGSCIQIMCATTWIHPSCF
jgi:hypothetical protein